ncbi:pantoate--beta-alanine ligase [Clostridium acetireducens]|uniref:pantoate--beta-alanine ligase n=1 Tax=Clostridium acetireducens TaxID=76489 RepID=UPI000C71842B|nr:pantoate--beta-alanine ligase [Clostridium acetireducens]
MNAVHKIEEVKKQVNEWKKQNLKVGLVPTMGYLHEGHKSLIDRAVKENDKVVVSVFLNPLQFGENEDLDKYPRDLERDLEVCEKAGANLVFNPEVLEMYPESSCSYVNVENLTKGLCGAKRPVHFRGVCTVLTKLFHIVSPDKAYFGEKDAQQLAVVKKMVKDLNFNLEIVGCPIIREEDGLAKSSRNIYLSKEERKAALILNKSLKKANSLMENGERNAAKLKEIIENEINSETLAKIDYIEIVDSENLEKLDKIEKTVLVAIAVYIGKTRLIDNFTFKLN